MEMGDAEFFLTVMLCKKCADLAKSLRDRARSEFENILATLDDVIRSSMSGGTAGLELDGSDSLTREQVITYVLALNKHWRKSEPPDDKTE
jgi:hypothetical protein